LTWNNEGNSLNKPPAFVEVHEQAWAGCQGDGGACDAGIPNEQNTFDEGDPYSDPSAESSGDRWTTISNPGLSCDLPATCTPTSSASKTTSMFWDGGCGVTYTVTAFNIHADVTGTLPNQPDGVNRVLVGQEVHVVASSNLALSGATTYG